MMNGTLIGGMSPIIKSVQRVTVPITAGNASGTQTITAVTLVNASLRLLGFTNDGGNVLRFDKQYARVDLTSTTQVTAYINTASFNVSALVEVTEFWPNTVRVQRTTITVPNNTQSATGSVSSVVTGNTEVSSLGFTTTEDGTVGSTDAILHTVTLTSAVVVTAARASAVYASAFTVGVQVREWLL